MSGVRNDDMPLTIETQQHLAQALEPYITEWTNSLVGGDREVDFIERFLSSETSATFAIWLLDKVAFYSTRWKEEWKSRQVAEAAVREVEKDLEKMGQKLKEVERKLQTLKFDLEQSASKEQKSKKDKEDGFLKRVAGNMKWER